MLISSLQNETNFRVEHEIYGDILMYATQLESISQDDGAKDKKYEHPLTAYASNELQQKLIDIFRGADISDLGIGIANVRNEIAHIAKPKKVLNILTMHDLLYISICLRLVTIGYVLDKLGVSKDQINLYQNNFTPSQ